MTTQTCPDRATLERFLLGKLTESEQSAIGEHLQNCHTCTAAADTLSPQDEITRAIRSRKALTGDEVAVALAAEKGKLLSSQLQTLQPDETVIGDKPQIPPAEPDVTVTHGSVKTSDEALNFLAPAQGPDELGRLGDYRILELLGMGGMGMVFRAEDARLKRQVALKVMKPSVAASRTAKDRFLREAQFTAAIEHDNIVQIFQVGEDNNVPFIAMPFLKGESLKTRQERVGRMSQKDVLKVGIQVAAGLAAAHDRNLIHRDIKPDNIWIEEKTGRAKILDFGLVRATSEDAGLTQSGMVMGTPRYMAPEQALGQDVDHRCDLFSLGSVLYQLASGKLPFAGSNVTATLMAVVQQDPRPLESVISGMDPEFCDMIARLMRKNRDDRPKTAVEVAKGLTAILQRLKEAAPPVRRGSPDPAETADRRSPELPASPAHAAEDVGDLRSTPSAGSGDPRTTQSAASAGSGDPRTTQGAPRASQAKQPPGKPPRRRFFAAAGAGGILLALLGIIVITIRDKDGKETNIRVQSATEIDVKAEPGSKVTIRQEAMSSDASSISNAKSQISNPATGWHGWSADAPKPAIAPFDAAQAKKHQEEWAAYLKVPVEYTNSIGMKFRLIPPGEFLMGSTPDEIEEAIKLTGEDQHWQDCVRSEAPQHKVILTQPIYLGANEVTQAEYEKVMGVNPSQFALTGIDKDRIAGLETSEHPVEMVSWNDAAEFSAKLSQQEKLKPFYFRADQTITPLDGTGYRLPSEAEWEFACRAGTVTMYWSGDLDEDLVRAGWFGGNSVGRTHAVRELTANPFGLFDSQGNVTEWVQDAWDPDYYNEFRRVAAIDPKKLTSTNFSRVVRGGHYGYPPSFCRSSYRVAYNPESATNAIGFRVVLTVAAMKTLSLGGNTPPKIAIDLTPAPPLGTWQMGPEPPWYSQNFTEFDYSLKEAAVLPGIVDRPALIPGIERWNVDTILPRGLIGKVAYSPDGKWIGVLDSHLSIFDARTLKLHQLLPGFTPQNGGFDFSWSSDSQRIVVATDGRHKVRVFDVQGHLHHEAAVRGGSTAVAWNPASEQFAVGIFGAANNGSCIEIYSAAGELLKSLPEEAATPDLDVYHQGIVFQPDGKALVTVHHDGKVRSWNIDMGKAEIIDEIGPPPFWGAGLSWHESGWLAISTRTDVRIYSPDLKLDHTIPMEGVGDVKWHTDGRRLLLVADWLQIWDRIEQKIVLSGEGRLQCGGPSESADWSPDGEEVVFSYGASSLRVAPTNFKQPRFRSPEGAGQPVSNLAWSPDGHTLAIGQYHFGPVKFLEANGTKIRVLNQPTPTLAGWMTWSTDGKELFGGNASGVWAATREGTVRDLYRSDRHYWRGSVANSTDGDVVIVSRTDGHLQILDRAGKTIRELSTGGNATPYIAWNHQTDVIAVAEPGQPLKFLDHHNGWTLRTVSEFPIPDDVQKAPVWSPDGKTLSIHGSTLWFDDSGKSLSDQVWAEAWRPDGQHYVSTADGYLRIFDRRGARLVSRFPQGHLIASSAWHPRGHLFAVGTQQSRFTVWNEAEFQPYFHGVMLPDNKSVTFSAAGELLDGKPEEIDQYLVYYIDRGDGRIETLAPAEFRKLLPEK